MSSGPRNDLRARMARLLDRELVERALAHLSERAQQAGAQTTLDEPKAELSTQDRLARDVWQIAAKALRMPEDQLDPEENLANLGIDSIAITEVMVQISRHFGISVAPTTFFEAKHLDDLSAILFDRYGPAIAGHYERLAEAEAPEPIEAASIPAATGDGQESWTVRHRAAALRRPTKVKPVKVVASDERQPSDAPGDAVPIAILSMEGMFPQSPDLEAFEAHLAAGDDCIEEIPADRWDWRAVFGDPKKGAFTDVKYGGFVPHVDRFDAAFFNISPREAELMDPQHRLFMECVWNLIEKGGYAPGSLAGRNIGLFLGINLLDYTDMVNRAGIMEAQQLTGLGHAFCPNRLSFLLDIHGPSEVVDTACSSSLVAIHRAVMSIRHEGCEMAIAGGSNLMLSPTQHIMFSKVGMIAPDGRCKTFSKDANGYARADGVGAVLLKRLDCAERDGDPILGVIRGSVEHHGGGATSLTAPNPKAQARLIVEAHRQTGTDPRSIGLIECHGTGTPLGDPIEIEGLKLAFEELYRDRDLEPPAKPAIGLGSVKSNIGHAETAAGVAGLIKVLLAIRSGTRYRTLHCAEPNPLLALAGSPFHLLQQETPWQRPMVDGKEQPRRAGLSSFGAGGANVHLVIEEYRQHPKGDTSAPRSPVVVPVSAKTEAALNEVIARLRKAAGAADLVELAYTLQVGRDAMRCRAAFVVGDRDDLLRKMDAFLAGDRTAAATGEIPPGRREKTEALDPAAKDAAAIAGHWAAGGDVDWLKLYGDDRPHRIALPGYAFQRKRYWLPEEAKPAQAQTAALTPSPEGEGKYRMKLTGQEVFLVDHRVGGTPVLPGVAYLELARSAAEQDGIANPDLRQVVWMAPLKVEQPVTVTCELTRLDDGGSRAEIVTRTDDGERVVHAQMRIALGAKPASRTVDLDALRNAPARHLPASEIYAAFDAMGLAYGPGHRVISNLAIGSDVLARLELPEAFRPALGDYGLYPSLMDGALQSAIGLALDGAGGAPKTAALPFSVDAVEILGPCESTMWAHVRGGPATGAGLRKMDIDLIADDGSVRVALRGFTTRALEKTDDAELLSFEPNWRPFTGTSAATDDRRRIVLLTAGTGNAVALGGRLPNWDCRQLDDPSDLPLAQRYSALANHLLTIAQDELERGPVNLQLVLKEGEGSEALGGLGAMLRSLHREHPKTGGQVLTIGAGTDASSLVRLLHDATNAPAGANLKANGDSLSMEVWDEVETAPETASAPWRADGVYLITGGTGKLGRHLASDILGKASDAIVILAGRNNPDPDVSARLEAEPRLHHTRVDLTDERAVVELVEAIRRDHGRLDGVIHAAGVVQDDAFARKTPEQVAAVLAPKVTGAVALDKAIGDAPLDFLVFYSSISGVTGNTGQADYAAANAFLDGFAEEREARCHKGLCHGRTLSIAWPLWQDGGMGLDPDQQDLMRRTTGLVPLETATGIEALYAALGGTSARLLVTVGNVERIRRFIGSLSEKDVAPDRPAAARSVKAEPVPSADLRRLVLASLVEEASAQLKVSSDDLDPDVELTEYGFDSIGFTQFANRLNDRFDLDLTPTLFFEYPTLDGLAGHLSEEETDAMVAALGASLAVEPELAEPVLQPEPVPEPPSRPVFAEPRSAAPVAKQQKDDLVAIIGMSGQFPGAPDVDAFWQVLKEGRDCISEVPPERWDWRAYWGDPLSEPGKGNAKWGGFIEGIAAFDAPFFGISAPEARMMDPQQRLLLTQAWRVIEDAGYAPSSLAGSKTGVFIGTADTGYSRLISQAGVGIEGYSMTALAPSLGPNRISYTYDFHGPSVAVETACSSALIAVHRAVEAIRSGHCSAAIAGGINALLLPEAFVGFSKAGMLSPEGHCKPFSARADGYTRGEGVGLVFLKPLSDAERDGDRIIAVIRASAENHGGHAASLTAPNPKAQAELLRTAYARSGIDPRTVGYIEAHGTGTPLGDPIEVEALTSAFADLDCEAEKTFGPAPAQSCAIGSVKSNIGHLELAAGIAGLIKVLLQMRHGEIARTLHCNELNPYLKLAGSPFHVAQQETAWSHIIDADGNILPRRAGVSSFGFGGSNAHVVLEEYPAPDDQVPASERSNDPELIILSAKSEAQLKDMADRLTVFLSEPGQAAHLCDIAHTLQIARDPMEFRLGLVAQTKAQLLERLSAWLARGTAKDIQTGRVKTNRKTMSVLESDGPLREAAAGLAERGRAEDLLALWVGGFNVDWRSVRKGRPGKRISLPGYPFAKTEFWVGKGPQVLAEKRAAPTTSTFAFDGSESFLRDHLVDGAKVLPGVMSFELVRQALARAGAESKGFELSGHTWTNPVSMAAGPEHLEVSLEEESAGRFRYSIFANGPKGRRAHALGAVRTLGGEAAPKIDLGAAKAAAIHTLDVVDVYRRFEDLGLRYGPAQRAITSLWQGPGMAIARLDLPAEADRAPELNPSILDGALQALIGLEEGGPNGTALPYSVRRVAVHGRTGERMWAVVRAGDKGASVDVCDDDGTVMVRLEDFAVRKLEQTGRSAPASRVAESATAVSNQARHSATLQLVTGIAARTLEVDPSELDVEAELGDFGFDSVTMTAFASRINAELGLSLTPADFFEYATLERLARHIAGDLSEDQLGIASDAENAGKAEKEPAAPTAPAQAAETGFNADRRSAADGDDPVVIVGQSCCFPMAEDADAFWSNLISGRDCITLIPADRWDWKEIDGNPRQDPGKTNIHWGGFIDRVFEFDPLFFAISPREAKLMDPQQRLMLMHAWKAIEDAGHSPKSLSGQTVGVFVGTSSSGYCERIGEDTGGEGYVATGSVPSVGPNRISYFLDLHGPSEPVETACSSSLVALHRAVQAIRADDCDMALVGGVNTIITPDAHINFARAGMLSPDGRCKTFSSEANGYVRGEGVGMLFLRRLSDAERDGDPILGVVRATAINHGGHANSLTAPNTEAQAELLRTAYARAGIDLRSVGYIEAHGTGTALGDPVEINALKSAFRSLPEQDGRLDNDGCRLGSVKTNIGHLELAAGVAGVIKVLKQIEHRQLAPSLHCKEINPYIDLSDSPFEIVRSARNWAPVGDEAGNPLPLRAGISSFGFGGVNAHVVLEEYRPSKAPVRVEPDGPVVVVLSARDPNSLNESARNLLGTLESGRFENTDLGDLAFTLQVGRAELADRLAIVAGTVDELVDRLKTFLDDRAAPGICRCRAKSGSEAASTPIGVAGPYGIAEQWVAGGKVDWKALNPGSHRRLRLPTYPFARDVYRIGGSSRPKTVAHQVTAPQPAVASIPDDDAGGDFKVRLNSEAFYLRDHRIRGSRILPGAMSLELVREAVSEKIHIDGRPLVLSNVTWRRPVELDSGEMDLRVRLSDTGEQAWSFRLTADNGAQSDYMRGNVGFAAATGLSPQMNLEALKQACRTEHDPDWLYASYAALGIDYGPAFRAVTELKSGGDGVLARLQLPRAADIEGGDFVLHPSVIDAAFHAALVSFSDDGATGPALPFGIDRMEIFGPTTKTLWAHLRTVPSANGIRKLDIDLADDSGRVCARIEGFSLRLLPQGAGDRPQHKEKATEAVPLRSAAERYFIDLVARETEIDASAISLSAPLEDYGIDSVLIMQLTDVLERDFGPLSKTLFFEHQTLGALLDHFLEAHSERLRAVVGAQSDAPLRSVPAEVAREARRSPVAANEPIAIIGVAGRYPGARSVSEFWDNLAAGRDSVTEVPANRWDHSHYFDPVRQPGKTTCKWGGFIDGHDRFDPMFFNIAPREAQLMDPQERLFLQCAWETLEDAGYTRATVAPDSSGLSGGDVGVFVGVMWEEYQLYGPERQAQGQPLAIGTSPAGVANRVSYFCNFHGPSMTVDSMCSSSLTAIHLACDSLRSGSCFVALAGGVNLTPHPNKYLTLAQGRFLSTSGRCGSFGEGGDGYVPAEGVGAVLLKPLSRAEADGDRIHGVILGSALNHGGKTNGYTVPNPAAQTAVIEKAMNRAGVSPDEVGYVEAHGTGTTLGDPIEIAALTKAWRKQGEGETVCAIGSVKSNIGHGESAAGIAGLTKILLQLKHGRLAPSLHAETLNPNIPFETSPFRVQRRLEAWPQPMAGDRPLPRIAGLSSFGAGGSNAHIVIAEHLGQVHSVGPVGPAIYPFSARDPERLRVLLANFRTALVDLNEADLPSVAFTLQEGREAFEERLAIVARDKADLAAKLDRALTGQSGADDMFRSHATPGQPTADLSLPLAAIAKIWVRGAQVDWPALRTGPKPAPISLPTYPFAEDLCWLPDIESTVNSPKSEKTPVQASLPLLLAPVWHEQVLASDEGLLPKERLVVLCGSLASNRSLASRLEGPETKVIALEAPDDSVDSRYEFHTVRLMKLLQDLARKRPQQAVVQVVVSADGEDSLLEGLGGLLRCAAMEHRNLSCQLVAVDSDDDLEARLAGDAGCAAEQNTIRYRQGDRFVRSWGEIAPSQDTDRSPWKQDGVYLLTGGAGGIGLHVAEAIAASGVRPSLWLTGRSHLKPEVEQRLKDLEAKGATVHYRRIDVASRDAVTDLLSEIDVIDGRVDGVFHGAGITRDGLLATKDEMTLREVLAPKVAGTRILDEALGNRPLDFLVLFASAAGALGNPGQSDYAAANAFLDCFAALRNERVAIGKAHGRTIAIDWPYWRDGGMLMDARTIETMDREAGVRPLETPTAIAALSSILSTLDEDQVLVLEGDHDRLRGLMAPPQPTAAKPQPALVEAASDEVRRSEPVEASGAREEIVARIKACFSTCLGIPTDRLAPDDTIDRFGVDSVSSLEIVEALEATFGPLPQTILFEFQTINRLADELLTRQAPVVTEDPVAPASQPPAVASEKSEEPEPEPDGNDRDIAIIAVAGRYPGADTIEAFGELLREGRDCVTEIPPERKDLLPRYSPRKGEPGASYCKWGGFLSDVECFDAAFFGYSPRAADLADPQERLFLETAWHLFERAGHTRAFLAEHYDKRVGVFVGSMYQQYPGLASDPDSRALLTLSSYSGIANRTSFFFDCQGPSVAVDSMCSSGLQAVHQACQSLRAGECRLAVAGGVNLSIHPAKYEALSRGGLVGSSAASRALSGGDGYLPAEGVGAVLLKPLGDALRDGDRVLAVIKGSLANHAGHSAGYAVPNADAQVRLIEDAFHAAGVDPSTVSYAEVAANGTQVGDAIELRALGRVYANRSGEVPLAVGSVKTNMGHAEAASGLAQLTKVLLQFERRELFPSFGTSASETAELLQGMPFAPQTALAPWTVPVADGRALPRRATVSSFGAGGSNVFLILEEAPPVPERQLSVERQARLFPVSARTENRLAELRKSLAVYVRQVENLDMAALSRTLRYGRETFAHRIEIVATERDELTAKLADPGYRENKSPTPASVVEDESRTGPMLVLPGYPFAKERHWLPQMAVPDQVPDTLPEVVPTLEKSETPEHRETALQLICQTLAAELGCPVDKLYPQRTFEDLGVDSMVRMRLIYAIEEAFGRVLSQKALETHATPQALARFLETETGDVAPALVQAEQERSATGPYRCPLGEAQTGLWVLQSLYPESGEYNVPLAFRVKSADGAALSKALDWLVAEYPILGTRIVEEDGEPVLRARPEGVELQSLVMPKEVETTGFLRQRVQLPFDLNEAVFRVEHLSGGKLGPDESIVLLTAHHMVTDGISSAVITRRFWTAYESFRRSEPVPEKGDSADYSDFAAWEAAFAGSEEGQAQKQYWLEKLSDPAPVLKLPARPGAGRAAASNGQDLEVRLPEDLTAKLRDLAREQGVSPASIYLTAFASLLYRYTGEEDLVIGVPTLRRPARRFEETVGYCANMIALRLAVDPDLSFGQLSKDVHAALGEGLGNSDIPFAIIAREHGGTATGEPPYQVSFAYQNFILDAAELDLFARGEVSLLTEIRQAGGAQLGIEVQDDTKGASIIAGYDGDRFARGTIERMLAHFRQLLEAAVSKDATPVSALTMLTRAESDRALHHWARGERLRTSGDLAHELVFAAAQEHPSATAIVSGAKHLSYRDLVLRSKQIALALTEHGVRSGDRVAVLLEREPDGIAALLAVIAIGAVWVPLDPDHPDERLGYILRDAEVALVLSRCALANRLRDLKDRPADVIDLDRAGNWMRSRFARFPEAVIAPDQPAYIIYTSGSTGVPKGVVVSHEALSGHCQVIIGEYGLSASDAVLQFAPTAVDTALEQILPPLAAGARLVLRSSDLQTADEFRRFLADTGITVADLPPVYLHELLRSWGRSGADLSGLALRLMIVGGEALTPELATAWQRSGLSGKRLVNAYGPTEATVTALVHSVKPSDGDDTIPIGRPLPGTEIYILDPAGNPVPDGVIGELHIGGERLALGYHKRTDLTEDRFRMHRLGQKDIRLYATGDLACFRPNSGGVVEFHGRIDDQVKIRGHRIELGEVEAALAACGVADCAVLVERNKAGDPVLTACLGAEADPFDEAFLRKQLSGRLPPHMVPSAWVRLGKLPKTTSGKIDRRALLRADHEETAGRGTGRPPRDRIEEGLLDVWMEVLGREPESPIGIEEDFADAGGHSLLAVRLLNRIEQTFGCALSVTDLAQAGTIATQARLLRQRGISGALPEIEDAADTSLLVSLKLPQPGGADRNLPAVFLIHPIGGTLTCYQALVGELEIDRPVWGIRAEGLEPGEVCCECTIEDLAARYCAVIRRVQPHGPYTLCGWSFGGNVAWEMARQLAGQGEEIAFVGLIDSYTPEEVAHLEAEFGSGGVDFDTRCGQVFLRDLFGADVQVAGDEDIVERVMTLPQLKAVLPGATRDQLQRLCAVFAANYKAFLDHVPGKGDIPVTLVRATVPDAEETSGSWKDLAGASLVVRSVEADHYTLLRPPHLKEWVPDFRAALERAAGPENQDGDPSAKAGENA